MNIFNRLVVILVDLALIIGAVLILLITFGAVQSAQVLPGGLGESLAGQWLTSFTVMQPNATLVTTISAIAILVVGLLLLVYELRPAPQQRTITIRNDGLGNVTVRTESVRDLILYTVAQIPDVLQVQPHIETTSQGVRVRCRTAVTPDASIPQVGAEMQARIKSAVEQHLGLKVADVAVQAQLEPLAGVNSTRRAQPRRQLR